MQAHPAGPRHALIASETRIGSPTSISDPLQQGESGTVVWPSTLRRNNEGAIEVGGIDVRDLVSEYGSPLFVLDETDIRERARRFAQAFGYPDSPRPGIVFYAAKAFLSIAVAQWVTQEGLGIDVASGGELAIAMAAGIPGDRILMHGNNKSVTEISEAINYGVGRIVIDSFDEIARVAAVAAEAGVVAQVLIRATVGVEAHTHEFIATAHEDQKFGFSWQSGDALEAVRRISSLPSLHLLGIHSHIGSQIFDSSGFDLAAARVVALAYEVWDSLGIEVSELNLGGGMGIAYLSDDDPLQIDIMADQIRVTVETECARVGIPVPALCFEPGRAIIGPGGVTVYEIGTVKPVALDHGVRHYVSVDGGMSDNIRTALYGAEYTVAVASRDTQAEAIMGRIVGKHCESGDIVVRDSWIPGDITPGDLIAVAATGAYCRSMASNYNMLPRPAVVAVRDGESYVVLRRETITDLLSLDPFLS